MAVQATKAEILGKTGAFFLEQTNKLSSKQATVVHKMFGGLKYMYMCCVVLTVQYVRRISLKICRTSSKLHMYYSYM